MNKKYEILNRLKSIRETSLLSQDFVATKLGVDRTTYARKENGYIPITTDEWILISQILEKDLSVFFNNSKKDTKVTDNYLPPNDEEKTLITLYRSLDIGEKKDLISTISLLLKRINRKKVRQSLESLGKTFGEELGT